MRLTRQHLRRLIRESIEQHRTWPGDEDPRPTPPEPEFVNSADQLAGYIVVYDSYDRTLVAHAPITRTDGPDRPFLVRTSDTRWHVPFWMVRLIYPAVQDAFNAVDSKEDWRGMGPGDRGEVGEFEWEWAEAEPEEELLSESTSEPLTGQIVSASPEYIKEHKNPMAAVKAALSELLNAMELETPGRVSTMKLMNPEYHDLVDEAVSIVESKSGPIDPMIKMALRFANPSSFLIQNQIQTEHKLRNTHMRITVGQLRRIIRETIRHRSLVNEIRDSIGGPREPIKTELNPVQKYIIELAKLNNETKILDKLEEDIAGERPSVVIHTTGARRGEDKKEYPASRSVTTVANIISRHSKEIMDAVDYKKGLQKSDVPYLKGAFPTMIVSAISKVSSELIKNNISISLTKYAQSDVTT